MYLIGHDIGTSAVKSVLTNLEGSVLAAAVTPLEVLRRGPLLAEQRPSDWLNAVAHNNRALCAQAGVPAEAVTALSFAAQMQGTLIVDAQGEPLCDALIWLDMRAAAESRQAVGGWPSVQGYGLFRLWRWLRVTNGVPGQSGRDPVAKILWLKAHAPDLWARAAKVLDVKDYVLGYATGHFVTSHDCGNTTWLMDTKLRWSDEICRRLGIEQDKLPELVRSTDEVGTLTPRAAEHFGLSPRTRVFAGSGDLVAMAIGTGATAMGATAIALGTSAWVSAHVPTPRLDLSKYTGSICSGIDGAHLVVAHQEAGGECLSWLRSQAAAAHDYEHLLGLAASAPPGAHGLVFLPWMNGEYAPVDDPFVRGGFLNLSFEHALSHMSRALLEGVAYNIRWALGAVDALSKSTERTVRIGGGGARSLLWCQTLSNVLDRPIAQVAAPELAVARGAAFIGLVGMGAQPSFVATSASVEIQAELSPNQELRSLHDAGFSRLKQIYRRNRHMYRQLNGAQALHSS